MLHYAGSNAALKTVVENFASHRQLMLLQKAMGRHAARAVFTAQRKATEFASATGDAFGALATLSEPQSLTAAWSEYVVDAGQRLLLTADVLRQRGDIFLQHEAAGAPPVLKYDYEVVMDGKDLHRPCNYMLLKITPPEGVETFDWKRPYVIIDPRAGHGAGIGGFKPDSQVGVALADGHPVYFVAFRPHPEPGQNLADVTHAEAAFLREVQRLHPDGPHPIVVGNCQGGWATAILAARNPDLAGPIVLNGAPMSYWAGRLGQDPMRYSGGLAFGALPALISGDLNDGVFDGADLVMNFEMLNPGRTLFRKYFDLYQSVDSSVDRFLEFEKWWGGFHLMNVEEIHWILDNLFIGNRLSANEARLETGRPIDLKAIKAPVIVFASHGDNITPPQQALNWIVDTYADEREIEIRGQRILYMVHEEVGHLGIFVSSSVAKREHAQMASTLKTIEALSPGLFEMKIEEVFGEGRDKRFTVSFHKRQMADILKLGDGRGEEQAFAAVARMSETLTEAYEVVGRPVVQATGGLLSDELKRAAHPLRAQRRAFSSMNPLIAPVERWSEAVREARRPAHPANPFLVVERLWADWVEHQLDLTRDLRAAMTETLFLTLYANPFAMAYGAPRAERRARKAPDELRALPEVQSALGEIDRGGFADAVVRMLVLLADTRSDVRRDRLERSNEVLSERAPFATMSRSDLAEMIREQTLVAHFEPEAALSTLPELIEGKDERAEALSMVAYVVGSVEEMEPGTAKRLSLMRRALGFPALAGKWVAAE